MISSEKLYQPILAGKDGNDILGWVQNQVETANEDDKKRVSAVKLSKD